MQLENMPRGIGLFGAADDIAVQRGIAEFQAGRPVVIADTDEMIVALPVDGLTEATWRAFKALCAPAVPRLVITARRARVIGLDVPGPVFIAVTPRDTRDVILSLAVGLRCERRGVTGVAGDTATRAIELAKLAQRFPALLVADAKAVAPAMLAQMIVVHDDAIAHYGDKILDTLEIVSEARIPLPDGVTARFCVFRDAVGSTPVAIILGEPDFSKPVNVRVHSA